MRTFALVILAPLLPSSIYSWIPPLVPSSSSSSSTASWEPVDAMRQRLGLSFNYTPSLLHPETCRFISAKQCEDADRSLQRHAESHRRRRLQGFKPHNPNLGTVKVLVLLIQFNDHLEDRVLIEKSVIENLWNTEIKRWFDENSQGAYTVDPVVVDWVVTDNSEAYYSFGKMGFVPELQQSMYPALNQLDDTSGWDWSQFDSDGNGELDAVVMMHSGYDAVVGGPDCVGRDAMDRIYPHAFSSSLDAWTSKDGSVTLNGYAVASTYDGVCDGVPTKPGLTCHEYMHTVGLIDLYDETDLTQAKGLGAWDIMSNPYGHDNSGTPGFLSVWSRGEVDWVAPEEIVHDGFYTLKPAETSNEAYRITLQDLFAAEYLLIENRQQISFDQNLWDEGLVIYHVDDAADGMKNRGYPGQDGWPDNNNHYRIALLPKDGRYDLEQNGNSGDAGDMWVVGDSLGPGQGNTVFPNTDSYQGGFIIENGFTIRVDSQNGNDVTFEVTGLAPAPPGTTASPTGPPPQTDAPENPDSTPATTVPPPTDAPETQPPTVQTPPTNAPQQAVATQPPTIQTPPTAVPVATALPTTAPVPATTPVPVATTTLPTTAPVPAATPEPATTPVPAATPLPTTVPLPAGTPEPANTLVPAVTPIPATTAVPAATTVPLPSDSPADTGSNITESPATMAPSPQATTTTTTTTETREEFDYPATTVFVANGGLQHSGAQSAFRHPATSLWLPSTVLTLALPLVALIFHCFYI